MQMARYRERDEFSTGCVSSFIIGGLSASISTVGHRARGDFHGVETGSARTLNRLLPFSFSLFSLAGAVSSAPAARRRHWGTINDYCRDYYRRSGEQAPLELFGGQFLSVHVVLCVQAARVYVLPLFLVSRESMHNPPTIRSTTTYRFSSVFRLLSLSPYPFPFLSFPSSLSFQPSPSLYPYSRSLFFISKILSIRANKLRSLNSTLGSAVRKIKRFSVRLPAKEWTQE